MKKMMRITLSAIVVLLTLAVAPSVYGQKYAYVDTEYILDNIPEFLDAQEELNGISAKWQIEIETEFAEVEEMYKTYQAEAVLLPEDVKRKREDAIVLKEKNVKDLQRQYFGPDGELFKKRQELIQPIQEKVFNAIESIATTRNFGFVFDKAGGMTLLYGNPKYDISDEVLDEVGNVMQTVKMENRKRSD